MQMMGKREEALECCGKAPSHRVQVGCRDRVPRGTAFPVRLTEGAGRPQAAGVSQALVPPLRFSAGGTPHKARPSEREQDRYRCGAPSQLDSAPQCPVSQTLQVRGAVPRLRGVSELSVVRLIPAVPGAP